MEEKEVQETLGSGRIIRFRPISEGKTVFEELINGEWVKGSNEALSEFFKEHDTSWE